MSIQIGCLELWATKNFDISYLSGCCQCKIFSLGYVGFTILKGECI